MAWHDYESYPADEWRPADRPGLYPTSGEALATLLLLVLFELTVLGAVGGLVWALWKVVNQ